MRKLQGFLFLVFIAQIAMVTSFQPTKDVEIIDKMPDSVREALDLILSNSIGSSNYTQGIETLSQLSETNDSYALYELGKMNELGGLIERNISRSLEYYNRSALLGNQHALRTLGFMYETGKNVPQDIPSSLIYYAFAAEGEDDFALLTLAYKTINGHNVMKSCSKAVEKYEIVATRIIENTEGATRSKLDFKEYKRLNELPSTKEGRTNDPEDIVGYYQYTADGGDAHSQVALGTFYLQGALGLPRDYNLAFKYFEAASLHGDPAGKANLGFMYANGLGTEQDNETAITLYKQAAEMSNPLALTNLALMYLEGDLVEKDLDEALKLLERAAGLNFADAMVNLGNLYFYGEEVPQDYGKALALFTAASTQNNLMALYNLASMYQHGFGVSSQCNLAVQLYRKVIDKGPWMKLLDEAETLYEEGDYEGALIRYEKLAVLGFEIAQVNAAYMLETNLAWIGPEQNDTARLNLALMYYRNAAEQKNSYAHLRLGDFYYYGLGTPVELDKAAAHYQAASDLRNPQAVFNLGVMHHFGLGVETDIHLAKRYYDLTLELNPDSILAVYLSLLLLGFAFLKEHFTGSSELPVDASEYQWDNIAITLLLATLIICIIIKQMRH